jgi:hypothetical protein
MLVGGWWLGRFELESKSNILRYIGLADELGLGKGRSYLLVGT